LERLIFTAGRYCDLISINQNQLFDFQLFSMFKSSFKCTATGLGLDSLQLISNLFVGARIRCQGFNKFRYEST
jgi:hypothetical protein